MSTCGGREGNGSSGSGTMRQRAAGRVWISIPETRRWFVGRLSSTGIRRETQVVSVMQEAEGGSKFDHVLRRRSRWTRQVDGR